jgi:hypothetical protein
MRPWLASLFVLTTVLASGCGPQRGQAGDQGPHLHVAVPPHHGTPVALGDDYQIEWVLDAPAGRLQAYILDGEMENFVRIAQPAMDVTARLPGREETLHLAAVANTATGETVGDTCLFEAQADWLKTAKTFAAVLRQVEVHGTTFTNISFNFPQ